jgi:hypothetical protein
MEPKQMLRNHLLAATMRNRWETLTEMVRALTKETGARFSRADVATWLRQLAEDGVHRLAYQTRLPSGHMEYRLFVREEKVGRVPQSGRRAIPLPLKGDRKV